MIFDNNNITFCNDIINLENSFLNNANDDSRPKLIIHNVLTLKNSNVDTEVQETILTNVSKISPQPSLSNVMSNQNEVYPKDSQNILTLENMAVGNTVKGGSLNYDGESLPPRLNNSEEAIDTAPPGIVERRH